MRKLAEVFLDTDGTADRSRTAYVTAMMRAASQAWRLERYAKRQRA